MEISWRRNFYILWLAQAAALIGFQSVQPFLPYYVQELGVTNLTDAAVWAGYMGTASGVAMAFSAPFWGMMADRFGRRPMVVRAMIGGGATVLLMAYARTPLELIATRFLQGLLAGSVTACITLVSTSTPRQHLGFALGMMQASMMVGAAVGMMGGGFMIEGIGYRNSFLIAGVAVVLAGVAVQLWVQEDFQKKPSGEPRRSFIQDTRTFLASRLFRLVMVCLMLTQFAFGVIMPVVPLFLQELAQTENIESTAGLIFSLSMLAGGVLSVVLGQLSDRFGAGRMLTGGLLCTAVLYVLQGFSTTVMMLGTLQVIAGVTKGAIRPVANVLLTQAVSEKDRGTAFGVMASATALGWSLGPAVGGFMSVHWGFRSVFGMTAVLFLLVGVWVWREMREAGDVASTGEH